MRRPRPQCFMYFAAVKDKQYCNGSTVMAMHCTYLSNPLLPNVNMLELRLLIQRAECRYLTPHLRHLSNGIIHMFWEEFISLSA